MTKLAYRPDVDGLRAVAVIPVVLFHLSHALAPGGFVGVDVFFVISGFLITAILMKEVAEDGRVRLLEFYKRRALRILPALFVMLVVVTLAAFLIMTRGEMLALAKSVPFIATSTANLYFLTLTNYFDPDAGMNALIHTWSLGVEEQFYIVYPLVIMACVWLGPARGRVAMLALIGLTFLANVALVETRHDKLAFYGFPFRAWEFGLGAIVAMGAVPVITSRWAREALALGGLALIGLAIVLFSSTTPFPGWPAAIPALGACLFIAYGQGTRAGALLSTPVPRGIGRISYSLYLWHWPVIILTQHVFGAQLGLLGLAACLGLMLAASAASYRLVERPFRAGSWAARSPRSILVGATAAMAAMVALGVAATFAAPWTLPASSPAARAFEPYAKYEERSDSLAAVGAHRCFLLPEDSQALAPQCLTPRGDAPAVLMFGDSHAAYLSPGLRSAYPEVDFLQQTAAGCTPVKGFRTGHPSCQALLDSVYADAAPRPASYQAVVLAARWNAGDLPKLSDSIAMLKARGLRVIVVGPTVEYILPLPDILTRASLWPVVVHPDRFLKPDRVALDAAMADLARRASVEYVSQMSALCPNSRCRTYATTTVPMAFDYGHYTLEGAHEAGLAIRKGNPDLLPALVGRAGAGR